MAIEITHITRMCNVQLHRAIVVPPPQKKEGESQSNYKEKVQLFFYGRCIKKNSDRVISENEAKMSHSFLGDVVLAKFKIEESIFAELFRMGLVENSNSDWDVIPTYYAIKQKDGKPDQMGVWFNPVTLLKLNGKDINYPLIRVPEDKRENAFEKYSRHDLGTLESQINAELEVA
jgi:hypothetical protein